MSSGTKEWVQYSTAIAMIISGIVLAFLSFFFNKYDIGDGVLWYIAQALVYAGGIFGVSLYFRTKMGDFESKVTESKQDVINTVAQFIDQKFQKKDEIKEDNDETAAKENV